MNERRTLPIVYNLQEWLNPQAPTIPTTAGGVLETDDREICFIIENGGTVRPWYDRKDISIQIVARNLDRATAGEWCSELAALMRGVYGGTVFPSVAVGTTTYPEVTAWQISPQGNAGYLGVEKNRFHLWSVNFLVTIGG